jgi:uncharacterized protein
MAKTAVTTQGEREQHVDIKLVDCDVHPVFKERWENALAPYLSEAWRVKVGADRGYKGGDSGARAGLGYVAPFNLFYPIPQNPVRIELFQPDLPPPCSDPGITARDLFDGYGVDRAVLLPLNSNVEHPNATVAGVIAEAHNSYIEEVWLESDARYRANINVPTYNVKKAVAEIERRASNKQWVGVLLYGGNSVLGAEHFWPIYEICEDYGLVVSTHASSATMMYRNSGSSGGGLPLYHLDFRHGLTQADQMHVATMVSSGAFVRFPKLKLVVTEAGIGWVPDLMWTLDAFWKGNREDTPWLTEPPSEYFFENIRFTTQPFIEPPKREQIEWLLEMLNAERVLMFSTDYPHWNADDPKETFKNIPERLRSRVAFENALETYGERIL